MEQLPQLHRIAHFRQHRRDVGAVGRAKCDAEDQHRQNGAHRAQCHQTKAVVRRMAVAADRRHAHAQRHDKRYRHGAGGHTAGVKGHGQKLPGHKGSQHEHKAVERHQQRRQRHAQQHAQERDGEEQAHARRHREDQGLVGDGGHLIGQHLQVRLRNGDEEPQQKADAQDHRQFAAPGEHSTHTLAHGGHAHFCAQCKEHDAHHDEHRTQQKAQQDAGRHRRNGKAQHQHNGHNGQHGLQGFQQFFPQFGERCF